MELHVRSGGPPGWPAVRDRLAAAGLPAAVAMIDGQLAFPDEEPPDGWSELRLKTALGMVTVRRTAEGVSCVVWGNADADTRRAWHAVAWACAAAGGGVVGTPGGPLDPAAFAAAFEMPPGFRAGG